MSKVLESHKVITCDCDDTLVMWDLSQYPELETIDIDYAGYRSTLVPNQPNINLFKKLAKLGYTMVIWSQSGYDWAEVVGKATGLDAYTALYMTKPRYHVDDLPSSVWMGERIWRDPVTGKDESKYGKDIKNG